MYIKFISKPGEWFDTDTEVFDGTVNEYNKPLKRISVEDYYKTWGNSGIILGFGLRVGEWDMEVCPIEEFDLIYTEEQL